MDRSLRHTAAVTASTTINKSYMTAFFSNKRRKTTTKVFWH
jgi:hypothetical protein